MSAPPFERRRAEDVFRVVENEVFPRLGAIDSKISSLDHAVNRLTIEGCAQRQSDLHRVEVTEAGIAQIFDRINDFGTVLADARVAMVAQVGGIKTELATQVAEIKADTTLQVGRVRTWVYRGVLAVVVALLVFFAIDYANDIARFMGKTPVSIPGK